MNDSDAHVVVKLRGITKRFPGVVANERVDMDVRAGEIHALLGENGAGKSTLMSALCGLYQPDEGVIYLAKDKGNEPQPADIQSPRDAIDAGIGMVHQHFKLVANQTVAENVILGLNGVPFRLNMAKAVNDIGRLAQQYHMPVDPRAYIWQLSVGEQQRVEILKLLYRGADVLILDEPTAVLTPQEARELGATLRQMISEGKAVIFISHKLDEVIEFADRITVLRDGRNVATVDAKDITKAELARMCVGREVLFHVDKDEAEIGPIALELKDVEALNNKGLPALRGISLTLHSGEVLGMAGVAGNGQRELAEAITGLRKVTGGQILLRGKNMTTATPLEFIRAGVAHIPGDRLGMGLAGNLPVSDNLIMKAYRRSPISNGPFLADRAIKKFARSVVEKFQVMTPGIDAPARNLSGGNQQKAILGREITSGKRMSGQDPSILVAVYPTRGLDVGAIEDVRQALLVQRQEGAGIFLISEDLDELMTMSDRIAVIHGGRIMGVVKPSEATIEEIGLMMAGESSE